MFPIIPSQLTTSHNPYIHNTLYFPTHRIILYDNLYNQKNNDGTFSDQIIILGSQKINNKYQITAWILEDNSSEFNIFWKIDELYASPPEFCQIYQDSKGLNHFLYKFKEDIVHHYWQIEKKADK